MNARYYEMKVSNLLNDPAGVLIEKVQVEAVTQGLEFDLNYTY